MHSRLLASLGFAVLLMASPAALAADAGCCTDKSQAAPAADKACCGDKAQAAPAGHAAHSAPAADTGNKTHACCDMPCCKDHKVPVVDANADLLTDPFFLALQTDPPVPPVVAAPARQATVVWFQQPVRIGNHILQGRYVIEHDNDRMAAGGPCTYIYAWDNQKVPVVAFHCEHLDRPGVEKTTVVLQTGPDGFKRLVEFQFPGDTGGHGTPIIR